MTFTASVVRVMIASPGDVGRERIIIRDTIHEWNAIHAGDRGLVLLPVGWETNASPSMTAPPQQVINEQILDDCDLLIGVFWTRFGTPTATDQSGTAEEIRTHIKTGRPAMLYFSNSPVEPASIDREQYDAVVAFREECKAKGLVETYSSHEEFRLKLARQLAHEVQRHFVLEREAAPSELDAYLPSPTPELTIEARVLLYHASQDPHGHLMKLHTFEGRQIQTNGRVWPTDPSARMEAVWNGALEELIDRGLVEGLGFKGEIFTVTRDGFALADSLGVPDGA